VAVAAIAKMNDTHIYTNTYTHFIHESYRPIQAVWSGQTGAQASRRIGVFAIARRTMFTYIYEYIYTCMKDTYICRGYGGDKEGCNHQGDLVCLQSQDE